MKSLNFEEIDVSSTPLSALRSCSEFQRYNSNSKFASDHDGNREEKKRSFFSMLFGNWGGGEGSNSNNRRARSGPTSFSNPKEDNMKRKISFRDEDEAAFFVESMGRKPDSVGMGPNGGEADFETGCMAFAFSSSSSSSSGGGVHFNSSASSRSSGSGPSASSSSRVSKGKGSRGGRSSSIGGAEDEDCYDQYGAYKKGSGIRTRRPGYTGYSGGESSESAIMYETALALDIVFGFGSTTQRRLPMEIELKNLREPQIITYSQGARPLDSLNLYMPEVDERGGASISLRTFERVVSDPAFSGQVSPPGAAIAAFRIHNSRTWRSALLEATKLALRASRKYVIGPDDDVFYETIRIQPFATGGYLRGMLVAGFTSLFFNTYSLALWPDVRASAAVHAQDSSSSEVLPYHLAMEQLLYCWLIFQFILNLLQLPLRLSLHLQCWESSRAVEVELAITQIRTMVQSDVWLVNRVLGRVLDCLSLISLLGGEIFLWTTLVENPLRVLVISLCATNLLAFVVRITVATAFSLSMHDPQVSFLI